MAIEEMEQLGKMVGTEGRCRYAGMKAGSLQEFPVPGLTDDH
jgi:hypothetical protein